MAFTVNVFMPPIIINNHKDRALTDGTALRHSAYFHRAGGERRKVAQWRFGLVFKDTGGHGGCSG